MLGTHIDSNQSFSMRIDEAADELGVSSSTLYGWINHHGALGEDTESLKRLHEYPEAPAGQKGRKLYDLTRREVGRLKLFKVFTQVLDVKHFRASGYLRDIYSDSADHHAVMTMLENREGELLDQLEEIQEALEEITEMKEQIRAEIEERRSL
jgi:DNA-binding transcriptional MerR regulator